MDSKSNIIIVGIGGCSRSGKTVLTNELRNQYKNLIDKKSQFTYVSATIHLDKYFNESNFQKKVVKTNSGNKYYNKECPGALDWDDFYYDIKDKINELEEQIQNSPRPNKKGILFIEGFLLFSPDLSDSDDEEDYLNLFDYYIYICLDKTIARERRMKTKSVPGDYYDYVIWPEHIKYCSKYVDFLKKQKKNNKKVLIIDGNKQYNAKMMAICILKWINVFEKCNKYYYYYYYKIFIPFNKQLNLLENNFHN